MGGCVGVCVCRGWGGGAGRRGHGLPAELERIMAQVTSLITETRVEFVFAH